MTTLYSNSMKTSEILKIYDGDRKMASFSLTGRNRGYGLHIMKLVLINDLDRDWHSD
jgi:hypothetical protein